MKKRKKITFEGYVSFGAAFVALLSLIVSIRSCQQAEQSLNLAQTDFKDSRAVLWTGQILSNSKLMLKPANTNASIAIVMLQLPKELFPSKYVKLMSPEYSIDLEEIRNRLESHVNRNLNAVSLNSHDAPLLTLTSPIPVGITCEYVIGGNSFRTHGLYTLTYHLEGQKGEDKKVIFEWLRFIRSVSLEELERARDDDKQDPVESSWVRAEG